MTQTVPGKAWGSQFREVRKSLGLTQAHIAKYLGSFQQTVARWECGDCFPHPKHAAKLLCLFGSAVPNGFFSYQLGDVLGSPTSLLYPELAQPEFGLRLREARKRLRLTQVEASLLLGCSYKTYENWESLKSNCSSPIIRKNIRQMFSSVTNTSTFEI